MYVRLFLQRKHNRECTLRKRRKKRHRRNQSRRCVWEWKWKCLTLQLLLAVIFVFSVAGLLGYGIFYLCQNESSRNTQKELQDIRGESKKWFLLYHIFWDLLMNGDQRP